MFPLGFVFTLTHSLSVLILASYLLSSILPLMNSTLPSRSQSYLTPTPSISFFTLFLQHTPPTYPLMNNLPNTFCLHFSKLLKVFTLPLLTAHPSPSISPIILFSRPHSSSTSYSPLSLSHNLVFLSLFSLSYSLSLLLHPHLFH